MGIVEGPRGTQGDVNECVWMLSEIVAMMVREQPPRQVAHVRIVSELLERLHQKAAMMDHGRTADLLLEARQAL